MFLKSATVIFSSIGIDVKIPANISKYRFGIVNYDDFFINLRLVFRKNKKLQ